MIRVAFVVLGFCLVGMFSARVAGYVQSLGWSTWAQIAVFVIPGLFGAFAGWRIGRDYA